MSNTMRNLGPGAAIGAGGVAGVLVANSVSNWSINSPALATVGAHLDALFNGTTPDETDAEVGAPEASKGAESSSKELTPEQRDLVEMAKRDKATGGITAEDMEAYKELNAQAGSKGFTEPGAVRGPEVHPLRSPESTPGPGQSPHGHVGPVNHIPIIRMLL